MCTHVNVYYTCLAHLELARTCITQSCFCRWQINREWVFHKDSSKWGVMWNKIKERNEGQIPGATARVSESRPTNKKNTRVHPIFFSS